MQEHLQIDGGMIPSVQGKREPGYLSKYNIHLLFSVQLTWYPLNRNFGLRFDDATQMVGDKPFVHLIPGVINP